MTHADRPGWLRRDGAPLAVSLVVHLLALLLIAPWLVMRTIPAPPVEVEVMLEPQPRASSRTRPESAAGLLARLRDASKPVPPPPAPKRLPPQPRTPERERPVVEPPTVAVTEARPGSGRAGRSAPAPRETAGLSAPAATAGRSGPVAPRAGVRPLVAGSETPAAAAPRAPSPGRAPQPSAPVAVAPSRPGADRDDGALDLAGAAAQAPSAQPEFRQAARQGGHAGMRGGSQAPDAGLARAPGRPEQTALRATPAAPLAPAGAGGVSPALAPPPVRAGATGGVAVGERAAAPGAGLLAAATPYAAAIGAAPVSRPQADSGQRSSGPGRGSQTVDADRVDRGLLAAAAPHAAAIGAAPVSRPQAGSGQRSSGPGRGSQTIDADRGDRGLLAAAAPATAAGPGSAAAGDGPAASTAGDARARQSAGSGSVPRDAGAPMQSAALAAQARERAALDGGGAQLSAQDERAPVAEPGRETRVQAMQPQIPNGEARVVEERFTAAALKVDSPRSVCELPLMFAGFDRKPIPEGLDTINASEPLQGEIPPRHRPGNQSPRYPIQALGQRAEGRALVRAEVRADGQVGRAWIKQTSGFQTLDQAALETVRSWRFYPAQRHGLAVAMWMDVPIEYKLP